MIHEVLRQIDLQGETLGWGTGIHSGPQVFALWEDPATHEHEFRFIEPLNDSLMELACLFGHNIGATLQHLAETTEKTQHFCRTAGIPTHDQGLLGIGLRSETIRPQVVELEGDDEPQSLMDIIGKVMNMVTSDQPPVSETRMVCFFHRDGSQVQVSHDRGRMPEITDQVTLGIAGVSLVRLLNTLVPEEVPLPDAQEM